MTATTQLHSANPVHFGWNNSDNPPKNYHFIVDEAHIGDYFEGINSIAKAQQADPLEPTKRLVEKAVKSFENSERTRLFILDLPDAFALKSKAIEYYFSQLLSAIIHQLNNTITLPGLSADFDENLNGIQTAKAFNKPGELEKRKTTLHWDRDSNDKAVLFLALSYGQRKSIHNDSALSLFADFNQWYQDQTFQQLLNEQSEEDIGKLIAENNKAIEGKYMIKIAPNKDSQRFSMFLNAPQEGGILHGVTPPRPIKKNKNPHRPLKRAMIQKAQND